MQRNPYTPTTVRLFVEAGDRLAMHIFIALLGGLSSWFVYVYVVRVADNHFWMPLIEAGQWQWNRTSFEMSVASVLVFIALGAALSTLAPRRPWPIWIAFVLGMVMAIFIRSSFRPNGFQVAMGVFIRAPFQSAVIASGIAFFVIARRSRAQSPGTPITIEP